MPNPLGIPPAVMRDAAVAGVALALLVSFVTGPGASAAEEPIPRPDLCLTIGLAEPDGDVGAAILHAVTEALAERPILIPEPHTLMAVTGGATAVVVVAAWTEPPTPGPRPRMPDRPVDECGADPAAGSWSASISGEFLRAGTKRELAAAPTTPGFSSSIDVEWDEMTETVRTVLRFAGPLDVPSGTCWMDDIVSADGSGGTLAETTTGSHTSPLGDGVCGRFEEYLADGGAGAQAVVLLPREVPLPAGGSLRLRVDGVDVRHDGIHLWGTVDAADS